MNNPDEEVMSQEEQEQEQEEQPKLRILKHKKKKPVSEKRRKQLARARVTKAKKAMQKRLMKEQEAQIQEEEQRQNNNQAIEDRLGDLIQQKVELAFEQFLGAAQRMNQTMHPRLKLHPFLVHQRLQLLLLTTHTCFNNKMSRNSI